MEIKQAKYYCPDCHTILCDGEFKVKEKYLGLHGPLIKSPYCPKCECNNLETAYDYFDPNKPEKKKEPEIVHEILKAPYEPGYVTSGPAHGPGMEKNYKLPDDKLFKSGDRVNEHHVNPHPLEYQCKFCGVVVTDPYGNNMGSTTWICPVCNGVQGKLDYDEMKIKFPFDVRLTDNVVYQIDGYISNPDVVFKMGHGYFKDEKDFTIYIYTGKSEMNLCVPTFYEKEPGAKEREIIFPEVDEFIKKCCNLVNIYTQYRRSE